MISTRFPYGHYANYTNFLSDVCINKHPFSSPDFPSQRVEQLSPRGHVASLIDPLAGCITTIVVKLNFDLQVWLEQ